METGKEVIWIIDGNYYIFLTSEHPKLFIILGKFLYTYEDFILVQRDFKRTLKYWFFFFFLIRYLLQWHACTKRLFGNILALVKYFIGLYYHVQNCGFICFIYMCIQWWHEINAFFQDLLFLKIGKEVNFLHSIKIKVTTFCNFPGINHGILN